MSEAKHTPVRWFFSKGESFVRYKIPGESSTEFNISDLGCFGGPLIPEGQANARLIASAPELLEACKHALPTLEECNEPAAKIVAAAIAKAEGK